MSDALGACLAALERVDRELIAAVGPPRSLAPGRAVAHGLVEIARMLLANERDAALVDAFASGMAAIARAQLGEFPDNLLWDRDALAVALLEQARATDAPADTLARLCAEVVALHRVFGASTPIRFRYVHDFVYGFDWAKWVTRDPLARAHVGPFDAVFLAAMRARGHELELAIARGDDPKYPRLAGAGSRNPFGFSREPPDELVLYEHLARAGNVPVEAWRIDARARWREPFDEIRRREAGHLGLADGQRRKAGGAGGRA